MTSPALNSSILNHGNQTIDPSQQDRFRFHLEPGVPTIDVRLRLTGTLQKATTDNNDAVVRPEAVERFLEAHLWVRGKGFRRDLVRRMSLRELTRHHGLNVSAFPTVTQPTQGTLNTNGTQTSDFELRVRLWGSPQYLFAAREKFWPAWDGKMAPKATDLYLDIYPNTQAVNADSDAGTDAFLSGGTDDYTFSTLPTLRVRQQLAPNLRYSKHPNGTPLWLPTYHSVRGPTYNSANDTEEHTPGFDERIALMMMRYEEAAAQDAVEVSDGEFNALTIRSSSETWLDEADPEDIEERAIDDFLAYDGADTGDNYLGYYPVLLAPGGRTRGLIRVDDFTNFRYVIDHDDPSNDPGGVTFFHTLLEKV